MIIADIAISIRECFAGASHVSEIDGTPRLVIHRPWDRVDAGIGTGHKTPCFGYTSAAMVGCFVGSTFASCPRTAILTERAISCVMAYLPSTIPMSRSGRYCKSASNRDLGSRRRGSLIYTSFCRYGLSEDHIATTPHDINRQSATSGHSITVHSANLKKNQPIADDQSMLRRLFPAWPISTASAGSPKHSDTRWLLCWKKSFIF